MAPQKCLYFALLVFGIWGYLSTASHDMGTRHEQWMARYWRTYNDVVEKAYRFKTFKANVELIEAFNGEGKHKYKLGANQFADLTNEEFKAIYNGFKPSKINNTAKLERTFKYETFTAAPAGMDWRTKGAVTPKVSFMLQICFA